MTSNNDYARYFVCCRFAQYTAQHVYIQIVPSATGQHQHHPSTTAGRISRPHFAKLRALLAILFPRKSATIPRLLVCFGKPADGCAARSVSSPPNTWRAQFTFGHGDGRSVA